MKTNTHLSISARLCGAPVELSEGRSHVALDTVAEMIADDHGLVHGGFVFGLADYAAMLAVNHPNVVLGEARTKFLRPVRGGDRVDAHARVTMSQGKKREVEVEARVGDSVVLTGTFVCFVLPEHVLAPKEG